MISENLVKITKEAGEDERVAIESGKTSDFAVGGK
jgi:hypothetical protein